MEQVTFIGVVEHIALFVFAEAAFALAIVGAFRVNEAWFAFNAKRGLYRKYIHEKYYDAVVARELFLSGVCFICALVFGWIAFLVSSFVG